MSTFPIYQVPETKDRFRQKDLDGVVDKGWYEVPTLGRCLIKLDDGIFNQVWKEKITSELAKAIGIPTATYEFGELSDGKEAIISPDFIREGWGEKSGKICSKENNYTLYTIENILKTIDSRKLELLNINLPPNVQSSTDLFTGYLLFDYLIANGDRHAKNWGIQIDTLSGRKELLPLYDCGFSMRFANSRNQGAEYLKYYTDDLETAINSETDFPIQMRTLIEKLQQLKPESFRAWGERIERIDRESIVRLFQKIPNGWIKENQINPTIDLLNFNRKRIVSISSNIDTSQSTILPATEPPNPKTAYLARSQKEYDSNRPKPIEDDPQEPLTELDIRLRKLNDSERLTNQMPNDEPPKPLTELDIRLKKLNDSERLKNKTLDDNDDENNNLSSDNDLSQ